MSEIRLQTDGITKRFGALVASEAVSIDLCSNEIHAIIGPNGAGKSTLIAQIAGSLTPDSGKVQLMSEDVTGLGTAARSQRGLARTFQISALAMEDSVLENALLGALGAQAHPWHLFRSVHRDAPLKARAMDALTRVRLHNEVSTPTAELSHGQRRLLEVAVALTLKPKVFLMDEPMAGLGIEGSKELTELMRELKHEAPILLVEHDMDAVFALADRISVLVEGRIIASGTVSEIRNSAAVREAYLGASA